MAEEGNKSVICKLCPAHPYMMRQLTNNKKDIKWIMRTLIVQLGATLLGAIGIIVTLGLLILDIIPRLPPR